jgi:hypothetical protein
MENAKEIWQELGLPELTPKNPWHGYRLGSWRPEDEEEAAMAVRGEYFVTGDKAKGRRVKA